MPEENQNGSTSFSLAPYTGAWTKAEAGHLLRRTMFGPTNQQILDTVANGMAASVYDGNLHEGEHNIPMEISALAPGQYMVAVLKESGSIHTKLVKVD